MKPCANIEDELWGHIKITVTTPHRKSYRVNRKSNKKVNRAPIARDLARGLSTAEIMRIHGVQKSTVSRVRCEMKGGAR